MSRTFNKLTLQQVAAAETPGRYPDGRGLFLSIASNGDRSWLFEFARGDEVARVALGDPSTVSLTTARQRSIDILFTIAAGQDPLTIMSRNSLDLGPRPTFGGFVLSYLASARSDKSAPRDIRRWRSSLHRYAAPLLALPLDQIETEDVLAVLEPVWLRLPRMAQDLRRKIERIFDAAQTGGFRAHGKPNPAAWCGNLECLLPSSPRSANGPHASLPWVEAPNFIAALQSRSAIAARCLEFLILTAARSGEVLEMRWDEIDWDASNWHIPSNRSSTGFERTVPLSSAAITLLERLERNASNPTTLAFSPTDKALSGKAIFMLLRRMGRKDLTAHGFRRTFEEWAKVASVSPDAVTQRALARGLKGSRDHPQPEYEPVRDLMNAWAEFLNS